MIQMGLFHQRLSVIRERVKKGDYVNAHLNLKEHIEAEHHIGSDLAGLATAIQVYRRYLAELEQKLVAIQSTSNLPGKKVVEIALKKESEEINKIISAAEVEVTEIQALISKLRSEARIKLK